MRSKTGTIHSISRFSLIVFLIYCLGAGEILTQNIIWQNTIGGNYVDELSSFIATSDGGFLLAGGSGSTISGDKSETDLGGGDWWIVKLNSSGGIVWENTIGGTDGDGAPFVLQTSDGGYVCGGWSQSNIGIDKTENSYGDRDYWIVKLTSSGTLQWQTTIGGSDIDIIYRIRQTADGGYIVGGNSLSIISGDKTENCLGNYDYWVVKLDGSGNIQWENTIGGSHTDYLIDIDQTTDGGYVCFGYSSSNASFDKSENSLGLSDFWVVKLNSNGTIVWENTIGGNDFDYALEFLITPDGGGLCVGSSASGISGDKTDNSIGGFDIWVVKIDGSGNIQWQKTIGGTAGDGPGAAISTSDGGFLIGANSSSGIGGDKTEANVGGYDYWVVKLSSTGNVEWQKTIGGTGAEYMQGIVMLPSQDVVMAGSSWSNIGGDKTENNWGDNDYWVVRIANPCALFTVVTNIVSDYNGEEVSCVGSSDGKATVSASGAVQPYSYLWSNGQTTQTVTGLTGGVTYTVTVTSSSGCVETGSVTLSNPAPLFVNLNVVPDNGNCQGSASATVSGGVAPYSFQWDDPGMQTTPTATGLCDGDIYCLTITDQNGCTLDTCLSIVVNQEEDSDLHTAVRIWPNPSDGQMQILMPGNNEFQYLELRDMMGRVILSQEIRNNVIKVDMREEAPGVYFVVLVGEKGRVVRKVRVE